MVPCRRRYVWSNILGGGGGEEDYAREKHKKDNIQSDGLGRRNTEQFKGRRDIFAGI